MSDFKSGDIIIGREDGEGWWRDDVIRVEYANINYPDVIATALYDRSNSREWHPTARPRTCDWSLGCRTWQIADETLIERLAAIEAPSQPVGFTGSLVEALDSARKAEAGVPLGGLAVSVGDDRWSTTSETNAVIARAHLEAAIEAIDAGNLRTAATLASRATAPLHSAAVFAYVARVSAREESGS